MTPSRLEIPKIVMNTTLNNLNKNQDFMVHIKYGSHKLTLKLDKDSTIDQLKQKISQALNIAERDLNILINGKPIPVQVNGYIMYVDIRTGETLLSI